MIKDLLTGIDGVTYDPARVLWALGIVAFLTFAGFEIYKTQHFDMTNFALAYSSLLGAGAAGVRIKETSEPK